jgi:hypothetical protein
MRNQKKGRPEIAFSTAVSLSSLPMIDASGMSIPNSS